MPALRDFARGSPAACRIDPKVCDFPIATRPPTIADMSDSTTTVAALRQVVADFVAERAWQKFHDPKNLSMAIAVEAAELMEHFQWARSEELPELLADTRVREEARDELADILCFAFALANVLQVDVSDAIAHKMIRNRAKYPADQFQARYEKPR